MEITSILFSKLPYYIRLRIISTITFGISYRIDVGQKSHTFFIKKREGGFVSSRKNLLSRRFFGYFKKDICRKIFLVFPTLELEGSVWGKHQPLLRLSHFVPKAGFGIRVLRINSSYNCSFSELPISLESLEFFYGGFIEVKDYRFLKRLERLRSFKFHYQHDSHELTFPKDVWDFLVTRLKTLYVWYVKLEDLLYLLSKNQTIEDIRFGVRNFKPPTRNSFFTKMEFPSTIGNQVKSLQIFSNWWTGPQQSYLNQDIERLARKFRFISKLRLPQCTLLSETDFNFLTEQLKGLKTLEIRLSIGADYFTQPEKFSDPSSKNANLTIENLIIDIQMKIKNQNELIFEEVDWRDSWGCKNHLVDGLLFLPKEVPPKTIFERTFQPFYQNLRTLEINYLSQEQLSLLNSNFLRLERLHTMVIQEEEFVEISKNKTIEFLKLTFCNNDRNREVGLKSIVGNGKFEISSKIRFLELKIERNHFHNEISPENILQLSNCRNLKTLCFGSGGFHNKCLTKETFDELISKNEELDCIYYCHSTILFSRTWKINNWDSTFPTKK